MGDFVISGKIDYFKEALNLLIRLRGNDPYDVLEEKMIHRNGEQNPIFYEKYNLLKTIEKEANELFREKEEEILFYFGHAYEEAKNIGLLAVSWSRLRKEHGLSVERAREILKDMDEATFCNTFAEDLTEYNNVLINDECDECDVKECVTPVQVIQLLMDLDIAQDEKWNIQKIFMDCEPHRETIFELISMAMELLLKHKIELDGFGERFAKFWKEACKEKDFFEIIEEGFQFKFDENPHGSTLEASVIIPNTFNIYAEGRKTIETPYDIRLGVLFDDKFVLQMVTPQNAKAYYMEEGPELLKILGDSSKFQILMALNERRYYASELAKKLDLTTATISHHMSVLTKKGLVTIENVDKRIYYASNKEKLIDLFENCQQLLTK